MEQCESFVVDSGVYSTWTSGAEFDYWGYEHFVRDLRLHPRFSWCLMPDVIDGSEEINDLYIDMFPTDLRGIPVYHLHESLERIDRLCDQYGIVALGSSGQWRTPGTKDWWKRMDQVMRVACDSLGRPRSQLHGLRMLDPRIFTKLPLTSGDSANVAINTGSRKRFGMYDPPRASVRASMIADRIESLNSPAVYQL